MLAALAGSEGPRRADLEVLLLGVRLTLADALALQGDAGGALALRLSEEARIGALTAGQRDGMDWDYEAGRVAALVGDGYYALGDIALAEAAYRRAEVRLGAGLARDPLNRKLLSGLQYVHYALSATRADLGDPAGGLEQAELAAEVARQLLAWDPTDRLSRQLFEVSQGQIALMLRANGQPQDAIALIEQQLVRYRALAAASPDDAAALRQVAVPLRGLAELRLATAGPAAGCAAFVTARAAWAEVEARFGLAPADRANDLAMIDAALAENGC